MQRVFQHKVVYDFDDLATVEEIAASVVANARFARDAVAVIQACHPGLEISDVRVRLRSISQESPLKELLTVSLVLAFQEDLESEVPDLIKSLLGVDVPDRFDSVVTVFVVGVSLYAAMKLVDRVMKDRKPVKAAEEYGSVIKVAGDLLQVPPELINKKMEEHLGGARAKGAAKSARDFFRPAKRYKARSITTSSQLIIPRAVIEEIPSDVDELAFEPRLEEVTFPNVLVRLRAHDLDKDNSGWAAVIEDISPDRVKLTRDPSIPAETLFTRPAVRGAVVAHFKENEEGEMRPFLYVLKSIAE